MKLPKIIIYGLFRLLYFLPVIAIVALVVLFFGSPILGPSLPGSDNANFITLAKWLSDWFPKVPFWFPQEGAGMSFTISYPILNHLIIVILEKITHYPIAVIFRVWSLITIALTSVGLYLLSFRLTRNQTVSGLAAIFYPLCPITWTFLLHWGFTAEQLSYVFIPPVLIFLSLFLDEFYVKGATLRARIHFLLFVVLFALLLLAHPNQFAGTLIFVAILLIVYPLLNYKARKANFKKATFVGLVSIIVVFLLSSYWLVPFLRYQSIVARGAPVEKDIYHYRQFLQNAVYPISVFNITDESATYETYDDIPQSVSSTAWRNVSFPFIISILALVGLAGSFFINRKVFAFGLANLVPLAMGIFPKAIYYLILLRLPFSDYFVNWRVTLSPSRFIIPLLAGFGCFVLAYLFTFPLDAISKKVKPVFLKYSARGIFILLSTVTTLVVASFLLWKFRSWPPKNPDFLVSYGTEVSVPSSKLDLRNVWRQEEEVCFKGSSLSDVLEKDVLTCSNYTFQKYFWTKKLESVCAALPDEADSLPNDIASLCEGNPDEATVLGVVEKCNEKEVEPYYSEVCQARTKSFWSQIRPESWLAMLKSRDLFASGKELFGEARKILELLPDNPNTRIDIGTSLGAFMMFEPFYSNVPELPLYYNQATLIKTLWNYQISVFNQKESVWSQDTIMSELAKYFGLEYTVISEDYVPIEKFERTGWERVKKWPGEHFGGLALWEYNQPAGLLRATTKPIVLVIGQDKVDGYFRTFHLANLGALHFDEAILVYGGPYADAYPAEELNNFDAVLLEGYSYRHKNPQKGWQELDKYIQNGGSLLINTGWQYSSADWQLAETPNYFPLTTLRWTDAGVTGDYLNENPEIAGKVDLEQFGPLVFEGKEWNISSSERSNLRDWAKVVISANGKPLIAGGEYGSGKVVWLGIDLPGHIGAYDDNGEEIALYKNLLSFLLKGKAGQELSTNWERNYPDKLEITINESLDQRTAVYWSEAYYPDFEAKLIENGKSQKIKVYKAGPGMTLFILPGVSAGAKIIYEYKAPLLIIIARIISLATLAIITIAALRPKFALRVIGLFSEKKGGLKKKFVERIWGSKHDEDINY
jgi:predicted cobalt transporter CbtA